MTLICGIAHVLLVAQSAGLPPHPVSSPLLLVSVTANESSAPASALDLDDLEHFVVSRLTDERVVLVLPASSVELGEGEDTDIHVLEFSVEQLEEAARPRWDWIQHAYVDDDVLHVEMTFALKHAAPDVRPIGGLYFIRDYRADDYGSFSRPQAVRAVVYEAAANLTDEFVRAAANGEFGESFRSIQRPAAPSDFVAEWQELSPGWKLTSTVTALVVMLLLIGLMIRILFGMARVFYYVLVPRSAPTSRVFPTHHRGPSRGGNFDQEI
jgi:hypothetical protein